MSYESGSDSDDDREDGKRRHRMRCRSGCCANAACKSDLNLEADQYITCPLCVAPAYCSEACRMIDWVRHDCPNVYSASQVGDSMFTPYFYEDALPADALAQVREMGVLGNPLMQSYMVVAQNSDMSVTQRIMPARISASCEDAVGLLPGGGISKSGLGRGADPSKLRLVPTKFRIIVERFVDDRVGEAENKMIIHGKLPKDTIFKGNTLNGTAAKLASYNPVAGTHADCIVFWPETEEVRKASHDAVSRGSVPSRFVVPLQGKLMITLALDGYQPVCIRSGYDLGSAVYKSMYENAKKSLLDTFERRLRLKFGGREDIKNLRVVHGVTAGRSMETALIFRVLPGGDRAELADVEFLVPEMRLQRTSAVASPPLPPRDDVEGAVSKYAFSCNPARVEDAVGLSMALELRRAQHVAQSKPFPLEEDASRVREHTNALLAGQKVKVTLTTGAVVSTAVDELHTMALESGSKK
jgi:hypothetical protein